MRLSDPRQKDSWLSDSDKTVSIKNWLSKYAKFLYLMSALSGSAFSAVELCNSYLFALKVFEMNLTQSYLFVIVLGFFSLFFIFLWVCFLKEKEKTKQNKMFLSQ